MQFTSSVILQITSLSKQFRGQAGAAVEAVTLHLQRGDLLGLLGPSGCGKTTLLRLIAGFERPSQGTIELSDRRVCGNGTWIPPEQRDVGIVFQDYALFPHLSVLENVAFGLKAQARRGRLAARQVRAEAQQAISLVGLKGLEKRFPHELSGGQQQRVALARAIAPRPALILLDEPFSNLDVQVRLYLRQEVREILKRVGTSGIFVTHDQEEALSISDCLAVMRQGRIEQIGLPEDIYQQPRSRFVAGFVTQANFLPAERQGECWQTPLGSFPVAAERAASRGELMVRQESLALQPDPAGQWIVRDRQFLGREYCYTLTTDQGQLLHARTSTQCRLEIGQPVQARVIEEQPSIFPLGEADLPLPPQPTLTAGPPRASV